MSSQRSAARLGGYFRAAMARAGGTELECDVAAVLGTCFAHGEGTVSLSASQIQARCKAAGVVSPVYWTEQIGEGTVTRVLYALRGIVLTWSKAWVARWHGPLPADPAEWPRLRPRKTAWGYRLPSRELSITGFAASLLALGNAAPGAEWREPEDALESEGLVGNSAERSPERSHGSYGTERRNLVPPPASTSPVCEESDWRERYRAVQWDPPLE